VTNSPPVEDYDAIAYPGHPFPQTHPGRLAALAALHGMSPAAPAEARVLELGCGDGANLVPMALGLPGARFVGIDLNAKAIARGAELATALQLGTVDLRVGDLHDLSAQELGEFDYVIAHGVYSWVPPAARDNLLAIAGGCLADDGVAYVSYNANPGDHLRQIARELMLNAIRGVDDPHEQVERAIAAVKTAIAVQDENDLYGLLLGEYLYKLVERDPAQVFHDDLATWCEPVQFHELIAHAGHHGLAYLTEADFHETIHGNHRPELLAALTGDELAREQQIDFLRLRMYRQTLLVRAGTPRALTQPALDGLRASSQLRPQDGANLSDASEVEFERRGAVVTTGHPVVKQLLGALAVAWPASLPVADLLGDDPAAVREALMAAFTSDLVELTAHDARIATSPKGDVHVSPLARLQAQAKATEVTNLRHERMTITLEDRDLLAAGTPAPRLAKMALLTA
jgi:SAM-dependent methyltransferase